ncbi:MAG: metalloregulator ArsR/SmtB family transcription factor [Acidobacteriia bacterium]|jgi:ArsR family transcriptional regulator|nr:metalloregulator ArsR/SmtB family transcription factor [Terriglobia bacterium]
MKAAAKRPVPGEAVDVQLKAVADPTRRRILELLKRRGCCTLEAVRASDPGMCVCDLEAQLGLTQPTVTYHLQLLREAGLITTRRIGRWLYCRRNEEALDRLGQWLKDL